jgi:hypothetical protein
LGLLFAAREFVMPGPIQTRHFVSLIPDPPRTAIRSVTHLVLARASGILFFH